jgi:hypothetical protein
VGNSQDLAMSNNFAITYLNPYTHKDNSQYITASLGGIQNSFSAATNIYEKYKVEIGMICDAHNRKIQIHEVSIKDALIINNSRYYKIIKTYTKEDIERYLMLV